MSSTISEKLCFSPVEAAKAIGIGRSTLFALLARGELKARKLGTRTLIVASELQRYVDSLPAAQFHAHQDDRRGGGEGMAKQANTGQVGEAGDTPLMTAAEVAQFLKVSLRSVRRQIRTGELPVLRIGLAVRISPAALAQFLSAQAGR